MLSDGDAADTPVKQQNRNSQSRRNEKRHEKPGRLFIKSGKIFCTGLPEMPLYPMIFCKISPDCITLHPKENNGPACLSQEHRGSPVFATRSEYAFPGRAELSVPVSVVKRPAGKIGFPDLQYNPVTVSLTRSNLLFPSCAR